MSDSDHDPKDDYDDRPAGHAARPAAQAVAPRPRVNPWKRGIVLGIILGVVAYAAIGVYRGTGRIQMAANRMKGAGYLSMMGVAIHNYNEWQGELPHNTYAPDGTPLLSWRVHLLPFIENDALYFRFKLDEPWDGPTNRLLLKEMPRVYGRPMDDRGKLGIRTHYRGFSSAGAVFERRPADVPSQRVAIFGTLIHPPHRFRIDSIRDDLSDTILVVEAWDPVEWTKPDDLDASPGTPFPRMGGFRWREVFQALMADESSRAIRLDMPEEKLRALVTHSGGETVSPD